MAAVHMGIAAFLLQRFYIPGILKTEKILTKCKIETYIG